ncbi:DUF2062 domain-containing protein [Chitinivorax sp. PXF-14]|uniref:DUF2062 domain-containing protein n=1 Tax=Chitinivorax sp. PXF-14 TaxID=3230488 RepID=UPI0034676346
MRPKFFKRFLPEPHTLREHRYLRHIAPWLTHPNLWHLNRRSVAGGVAIGLFSGLVPGPLQMLSGALLALAFKRNLPVAMATTLYTNPLTIVPLYLLAFEIGKWLLGTHARAVAAPVFAQLAPGDWLSAGLGWMTSLGTPLLVGLPTLATALAVLGYITVNTLWIAHTRLAWRARARARREAGRQD